MAKAEWMSLPIGVIVILNLCFCQCHLASVIQSSAEGRPIFTNFVDRVNRGPSIRSNEDEPDMAAVRLGGVGDKTPAFQQRFQPNRHSSAYNHLAPNSLSMAQLSPFHIQRPTDPASSAQGSDDSNAEAGDNSLDREEEAPTFTPFIGARALSNMGKFFEHLRENLVAMQQEGSGEIGQPERRRMTSGENSEDGTESRDNSFTSSETRALAQALGWTPPATGNYRDRNVAGMISSAALGPGFKSPKYQTFVQPLTEHEIYLRRANNYNPSWLWTNMGLGRKRR